MMNRIRKIMNRRFLMTVALMIMMPVMMGAQALKGSYFLDNSLNRNKLNPAFSPRSSYIQIPVVGNFNVGVTSTLSVSNMLYPKDGQLVTFLHKDVSLKEFSAALPANIYADENTDVNLINFGWRAKRSYWTVDFGVRMLADIDASRDLFMFMKEGMEAPGRYNLGPIKGNISVGFNASLGYSRDLSDVVPGLSIGARVRGILPFMYVGLNMDDVYLDAATDKWTVTAAGGLTTAVKGVDLVEGADDIDYKELGLAGWGMSFDLGAEYKMNFDGFVNGLNFSASVTDLGFIRYNGNSVKSYVNNASMDWTGMMISLKEGNNDDAMADLEGQWEDFLKFEEEGSVTNMMKSSLPSFYLGVEMPFCNNLMSVGALYSGRVSYYRMRNELTLSYNLNPAKWFALGVNYSFLNVRKSIGAVLEITPRVGPAIHVGCDYFPLEYAPGPQEPAIIPTESFLKFGVGISYAFGKKRK